MHYLGTSKACMIRAVDQWPVYSAWFLNSWPDAESTCSRRRAVFAMAQQSAPRPIVSFNSGFGFSFTMIQKFDISNVNRASSAFDVDKLRWLNQHYIKGADTTRLALMLGQRLHGHGVEIQGGPPLSAVVNALRNRAQTVEEMAKKSFNKVVIYKPISSKKESKEIYIYCKGLLNIY